MRAACELADRRGFYQPFVEQPMYHLLDRSIEQEVMPAAEELGMGLVVWSPLAGGLLTGKYNDGVPQGSRAANTRWLQGALTPQNIEKVRQLTAIAQEIGCTTAQLALAWLLTRPQITSVITGATTLDHVRSNLKAAQLELDQDVVDKVDALFTPS